MGTCLVRYLAFTSGESGARRESAPCQRGRHRTAGLPSKRERYWCIGISGAIASFVFDAWVTRSRLHGAVCVLYFSFLLFNDETRPCSAVACECVSERKR